MKKKNDAVVYVPYSKELPLIKVVERNPDGVTLREVKISGPTLKGCKKIFDEVWR